MLRRGVSLIILTFLFASIGGNFRLVQADTLVTVVDNRIDYKFGEQITFWAQLQSSIPIRRVEVLYRPQNASNTLNGEMILDKDVVTYKLDLILYPQFIPVFSFVEYRYRITLEDGQVTYSDNFSFQYKDDRFIWQPLEEKPFSVYWIDGDTAFGQSVLDAARNGLKKAQEMIVLPDSDTVDIYVYAHSADLQSALQLGGFDLAAGHASPELGVITVSLPAGPAQLQEIQRQIPHELMHMLLYKKLGDGYKNVPNWLNEGLASLNETSPNPDYYVLLQDAVKNGTVLPMESLCSGFRPDASIFYLSYAQSESFTRYLYDNYGSRKLEELLSRYADGVECTRAPELVYEQSFTHLQGRWLSEMKGETYGFDWLTPLLPWLAMLIAVLLVPFILVLRSLRQSQPSPGNKRIPRGG